MDALRKKAKKRLPPGGVLAIGFIVLITLGSLLLFLPISNRFETHGLKEYFDCLFTAASSVCVTGLSVINVAKEMTPVGQAVMLLLIQFGGLGFMTIAVLFFRVIKRRITPKEQIIAAQACGFEVGDNVRKLIYGIIRRTLIIEGIGALLLSAQMWKYAGGSVLKTIWFSIFHSVSAFCNAGFDVFPFDSLTGMYDNAYILIVIMLLICFGDIGFVVWDDVINRLKDRHDKLSVYTRFILAISLILFLFQAAFTFAVEYDNPETLGNMNLFDKIINSCFHSVTLRTAGFATLPNECFRDITKLTSCMMMFIGGCSGSTAGGIKVGTIGIIVFTVFRYSVGRKNLNVGQRSIDVQVFMRGVSLFFIGLFLVLAFTGIFSAIESRLAGEMKPAFIDLLYETVSAFGTVGLSANLTPYLHFPVKLLLILLMYFGRVGVLTVTTSFVSKSEENNHGLQYPTTAFYVG